MKRLLLFLAFCVVPAALRASYVTVTFDHQVTDSSGLHLYYQISGDAGEPIVTYRIDIVDPGPGVSSYVNSMLYNELQALNRQRTIVGMMPSSGQILAVTPPFAPSASTFGAFHAASAAFTPGSTPQDVCTLSGSATKAVTVASMELGSTQTTTGTNGWQIVKRSALDTLGTSSTLTLVPLDLTMPAATVTARTYTVNPTLGALVGNVWSGFIVSPAPASAASSPVTAIVAFAPHQLVLGPSEQVAWNFGGAALPAGLSVRCVLRWAEQ